MFGSPLKKKRNNQKFECNSEQNSYTSYRVYSSNDCCSIEIMRNLTIKYIYIYKYISARKNKLKISVLITRGTVKCCGFRFYDGLIFIFPAYNFSTGTTVLRSLYTYTFSGIIVNFVGVADPKKKKKTI